jgi:hypothetical protein
MGNNKPKNRFDLIVVILISVIVYFGTQMAFLAGEGWIAIIALAVGFYAGDWHRSQEVKGLQADMGRTFEHWDTRVGVTTLWNGEMTSYNLRTFDSGKHWYQVEYDDDFGMRIVCDAEELYPGLVGCVMGMEKLIAHGPVTLTNAASPEADLLRSAGFSVVDTSDSN